MSECRHLWRPEEGAAEAEEGSGGRGGQWRPGEGSGGQRRAVSGGQRRAMESRGGQSRQRRAGEARGGQGRVEEGSEQAVVSSLLWVQGAELRSFARTLLPAYPFLT